MYQPPSARVWPSISRSSLPESLTSSSASRSAFSVMRSASARIRAARWKPVIVPHAPSSAARAALTAASTSSGPASGTVAHGDPR